MTTTPWLGTPGPAQSDELIHFTGRPPGRPSTPGVPQEIRALTPWQRLDNILTTGILRAFPPFGAQQPVISFSESPPDHLAHLISERGFPPWGVVLTRVGLLQHGGGSVAYLPENVRDTFPQELRHWAVPFKTNGQAGDWSHEREWRLPATSLGYDFGRASFNAILVGDTNWRPTRMGTGVFTDQLNGLQYPGPATPYCQEQTELPPLWRGAGEIWVWNAAARRIDRCPPSALA